MTRKYPAILPLCFLVLGILLSDYWSVPSWVGLGWLLASLVTGLVLYIRRSWLAALFLSSAFAGFGAVHFAARVVDSGPRSLAQYADPETVTSVYGEVADWPDLRSNRTELLISVDSLVGVERQITTGNLLLKVSDTTTDLQRGDRVEFSGRLYPVPMTGKSSGFDYGRFLRLKEIGAIVYLPTTLFMRVDRKSRYAPLRWVDNVRADILSVFEKTMSPRSAALASGFLIGETRNIPPDIYRMFRDSGTMHLLAVSGSNVALVVLFALGVFRPFRISRKIRAALLLVVIALFVFLSYGEPSVVRAAIMASLVIVARLLGRKVDLNHIISLAALMILLFDPTQLFDVGFQLSFLTAWGLIFIVPRLAEPLHKWHNTLWYRWLVFPMLISAVAQVVSTPIIAVYFHRLPVVSVLANLIIVPLVSLSVLASLVVLIAYAVLPLFGLFVGSLVNHLLELIVVTLVRMGGENLPVLSTAGFTGGAEAGWIALLVYIVLIFMVLSVQSRTYRRLTVLTITVVTTAGLLTAVFSENNERSSELLIRRMPGGIAALVKQSRSERADLIITGLVRRDYRIDEKILEPLLKDAGVDYPGSVFLMEGDFGSLRDVFRFCARHGARQLYLPLRMKAMAEDIRREDASPDISIPVEYYGKGIPPGDPLAKSAWLVGADAIALRKGLFSALFVTDPDYVTENRLYLNYRVIAAGRPWSQTPSEWNAIHGSGVDLVVAAGIRQLVDSLSLESGEQPMEELPDYLVDLSRLGEARLILSDKGDLLVK